MRSIFLFDKVHQLSINSIFFFFTRIYVESRLAETKICQDFMVQLMDECGYHYDALFQLARLLRNSIARNLGLHRDSHKMDGLSSDVSHPDIHSLDLVLKDTAIREVHAKVCNIFLSYDKETSCKIK